VLEKKGYLPIQKSTDEGLLDRNVFYRSMLSISKNCIFTVPFTRETREDRKRSIFLEELEFLFSNVKEGKLISGLKKKSIPPSMIILPVDKTASKTEFEISLASELKDKNIEVEPVSIKNAITRYKPAFLRNPNLKNTAGSRYFKGVYSSKDLKKYLKKRFFKDGRFIFSPSMIEQFLRCPYKFFMQYLQKLEVFPRPEFEMNIMDEGTVTHAILERFCRERDTGEINPEKRIKKIAGEIFSDYEKEHFTGRKELWVVKKEGILQTLKNFLLLEEKSSIGPGKTRLVDAEYKVDNCIVDLDGEKIALRGVIDRIDCAADGTIYVIDYKTSSKPRKDKDYQQGYLAQAALYKLILLNREVADNLKLENMRESKIKACYFALKVDPYDEKGEYFTEIAASSNWKEILKDKIMKFKRAVERMEFPAEPIDKDSDKKECEYCDFAYFCRIGEDWNG
ncbi:MAG: PD-(D/E)XK nuclease family protein, partial [Candidatus Auribacterota bacterium]|nr:PD-(D/E)XK nuclease family protein [Candidatus Auribacterota bacterium]